MQSPVERFAHAIVEDKLRECKKDSRFETVSQERLSQWQAEELAKATEYGNKIAAKVIDRAACWEHCQRGGWETRNNVSRRLFTDLTGIVLPSTNTATREAIAAYVGAEVVEAKRKNDAEVAEREAHEHEEKRQATLAKRLEQLRQAIVSQDMIGGDELAELASMIGVELHPRTIGTLRQRVHLIGDGTARVKARKSGGYSLPQTCYAAYKEVRDKVAQIA